MTEEIKITINGQTPRNLDYDLIEVIVDTNLSMPSMFSLLIKDEEDQKTGKYTYIDSDVFKIGAKVKISITTDEIPMEASKVNGDLISGEITAIEPVFTAGGPVTLKIRGYDKAHRLTRGKKSRTFLKVKDSDLVSKIASGVGLSTNVDATNTMYEYLMQHNMTDWDFLQYRARRIGYQVYVNDEKLCFKKIGSQVSGGNPATLTWGLNLRKFEPRISVVGQFSSTTATGWDVKQKAAVVGKDTGSDNIAPKIGFTPSSGGKAAETAFTKAEDFSDTGLATTKAMADEMAKGIKNLSESTFIQAEGELAYGDPRLIAGKVVEIDGVGTRFKGKYHVTEAQHYFGHGEYTVTFGVSGLAPNTIHSLLNSNNQSNSHRIDGVVSALVTSIKDPDKLGRAQVKFPWMSKYEGAELSSTWARVASIGAGKERGIFFMPEIDDEVLVAFEQGDVNLPYIVGGLWNGKDKLPPGAGGEALKDEDVERRIIRSRSGHLIELNDENGKEKITIQDKSKNNLIEFDTSKNSITFKAKGDLIFEADGKFSVTSKGEMSLTTKAGAKIESQSAMTLESKQKVGLKAGPGELTLQMSGAALKGPQVEVNGSAQTTLKSGGIVQIQGSLVKIN